MSPAPNGLNGNSLSSTAVSTNNVEPTQRFSALQQQLLCAAIHFFHRHVRSDPEVLSRMEGNGTFRLFYEKQYHCKPSLSRVFNESVHDASALHICSFILSILHQGIFSVSAFIVSVIYLSRFKEASHITLHACTWRPLFVTSLLLADKMWEDKPVRNSSLVKLFPVLSNQELNLMENRFLKEIQFNVLVRPDLFCSFCEKLLTEQVNPEIIKCVNSSEYAQTLGNDGTDPPKSAPVSEPTPSADLKAAVAGLGLAHGRHPSAERSGENHSGGLRQALHAARRSPNGQNSTTAHGAAGLSATSQIAARMAGDAEVAEATEPRSQSAGPVASRREAPVAATTVSGQRTTTNQGGVQNAVASRAHPAPSRSSSAHPLQRRQPGTATGSGRCDVGDAAGTAPTEQSSSEQVTHTATASFGAQQGTRRSFPSRNAPGQSAAHQRASPPAQTSPRAVPSSGKDPRGTSSFYEGAGNGPRPQSQPRTVASRTLGNSTTTTQGGAVTPSGPGPGSQKAQQTPPQQQSTLQATMSQQPQQPQASPHYQHGMQQQQQHAHQQQQSSQPPPQQRGVSPAKASSVSTNAPRASSAPRVATASSVIPATGSGARQIARQQHVPLSSAGAVSQPVMTQPQYVSSPLMFPASPALRNGSPAPGPPAQTYGGTTFAPSSRTAPNQARPASPGITAASTAQAARGRSPGPGAAGGAGGQHVGPRAGTPTGFSKASSVTTSGVSRHSLGGLVIHR